MFEHIVKLKKTTQRDWQSAALDRIINNLIDLIPVDPIPVDFIPVN